MMKISCEFEINTYNTLCSRWPTKLLAESRKTFKTRPKHRRTDANLYPPERQLTKASEPSFDLEGGVKGQI